jgi:aminopeptidase N
VVARLTRCLLGFAVLGLWATSAAGAAGSAEPFFPRSGSSAYDVGHYDVQLAYRPVWGTIQATARIEATARQGLSRFSLDFVGLRVTAVSIDGKAARFNRGWDKLKIVPAQALKAGQRFTVTVDYQGRPQTVVDPDGSNEGWNPTPDGAIAVGEPIGTAAWIPAWTLVDPAQAQQSARVLAKLPEIIRFESKLFGPYPFDAAGSVVDAADLEYALETQTRPIYAFVPNLTTVVHETAHQWFGDSVSLKRWPNIWLNEGFATWTEWYYAERHGGRSAAQTFHKLYQVPATNTAFWDPPSGHPGQAKNLFATSTYVRGGMALEALRIKIGTKLMLTVLLQWTTRHRYANADIEQFVELAEEVSGQRLGGLFQRWLFARGKPPVAG